jgi:hypothetical protein
VKLATQIFMMILWVMVHQGQQIGGNLKPVSLY